MLQKEAFNKYIVGLDEEESEKIIEVLDNINLNDFYLDRLFDDIETDIDLFKNIFKSFYHYPG